VVSDGADKFYTRAGQFDVDEAGRLVTADHRFQVQDAGGVGVVVDPTVPFAVTGAGDVLQNGTLVAQLGVVTFRRPEALRPAGGGLWTAAGGEQPAPTGGAVVRQGYLEGSTVDAVRELVSMLEAFRAYEANLNLIASQDATLRRLVSEAARGV
jgi:flagellar basal-body rod protein FlgF